MKDNGSQHKKDAGRSQRRCQRPYAKRMPEASDKGSQPYSRAYRYGEMAGMGLSPNSIACPWVGDKGCVCPLPKGKVPGVWCRFPAISQPPRGAAVWLAAIV